MSAASKLVEIGVVLGLSPPMGGDAVLEAARALKRRVGEGEAYAMRVGSRASERVAAVEEALDDARLHIANLLGIVDLLRQPPPDDVAPATTRAVTDAAAAWLEKTGGGR